MKKILIIAGPNGAGKTSFAGEFLPNEAGCPEAGETSGQGIKGLSMSGQFTMLDTQLPN